MGKRFARLAAALIALAAVAGVVLLYRDYVAGKSGAELLWKTIDFFSFFTVESNILVAALTGALAIGVDSRVTRPAVAGAACLYIAVTGVTYFYLLRKIHHPEGLALLAVNLLHYTVPPAFVVFWLVFVPKGSLGVRGAVAWLVFPIVYAAYTLIRGPFVGFYPYPFIDVATLGLAAVLRNIVNFVIGFAVAAALIVAVDRLIGRMQRA